jgi:tetratricopeptide (TPR) repeat protein
MKMEQRITAAWHLLRDDSRRGAIARRRATAMGGMAIFMLALIAAIGFLWLVLLFLATLALAVNIVAGGMLLRRYLPQVAHHRGTFRSGAQQLGRFAVRAGGDARRAGLLVNSRLSGAADRAARELRAATANVRPPSAPWPMRSSGDVQRDAVHANATGSQLRRAGAFAEAADQHRIALELYRSVGDRRAEALTLNNLALALDRTGDASALELFEEAATILGDLGEEEREGQVIANLALAFRRRGREEQSAEVLEVALGKLNENSQEYRKLEELRRAS